MSWQNNWHSECESLAIGYFYRLLAPVPVLLTGELGKNDVNNFPHQIMHIIYIYIYIYNCFKHLNIIVLTYH